jgi:YesN/AraC family two-component response regulator
MLPKHVLQMEGHSDDFSALHIICSERFMNDLSKFFTKYFPHYIDVSHNPVLPLKEEELDFFVKYYSEIEQTLSDKNNPYRREIIMHQTMLFFYKTSYCYHQYSEKPHKTGSEIFVDNFMDLVRNHYTKHRLLDFYADKLGLTPKYLTTVIKRTSGISATDWIEKFVILEAQALLKSTNLTVQQSATG